MFSFQQTLDGLNPAEVPNLDKAKLNVWEFVHEVLERLKAEQSRAVGEEETMKQLTWQVPHEHARQSISRT